MCISLERAAAQAEEYGHSVERELSYLAVHSVLHLLGYDHMDEGPMKAQMRRREEHILEGLGIRRGMRPRPAGKREKMSLPGPEGIARAGRCGTISSPAEAHRPEMPERPAAGRGRQKREI